MPLEIKLEETRGFTAIDRDCDPLDLLWFYSLEILGSEEVGGKPGNRVFLGRRTAHGGTAAETPEMSSRQSV